MDRMLPYNSVQGTMTNFIVNKTKYHLQYNFFTEDNIFKFFFSMTIFNFKCAKVQLSKFNYQLEILFCPFFACTQHIYRYSRYEHRQSPGYCVHCFPPILCLPL